MLNIPTHRVTTLEDAEAWADARQPSRYLHTQAMVYRSEAPPTVESIREGERRMGCNGNCNQGRMCDCVPDLADDADADNQFPGFGAVLVPVAIALFGVVALFLASLAGVLPQ